MKVTAITDISEIPVSDSNTQGVFMKMLVGPKDEAENFFLRRFRVTPGGHTPLHQHDWEHEVFVLSGQGEVYSDQGPRKISTGSVIFIASQEMHQFRNNDQSDLEFLCIVPSSSAG